MKHDYGVMAWLGHRQVHDGFVSAVHNLFLRKPRKPRGKVYRTILSSKFRGWNQVVHRYDAVLSAWVASLANSPDPAPAAPAALTAFLRGVERRAAVFAELQSGDSDAGDTALAGAMRAFRNAAATQPMAEWPGRFWALLVATPQLRRAAPTACWPGGLQALAVLPPAPRQALLLRMAAGLQEAEAASASGLSLGDYQQALAQACPRDNQGQVDVAAWRQLAESIQQHARELAPDRLARLAQVRERAVAALPAAHRKTLLERPVVQLASTQSARRRRRAGWMILGVATLCLLALAATWWWPHWQASRTPQGRVAPGTGQIMATPEISTTGLPEQAPAARFDAATGLLAHPDFELVQDEQGEAVAREADFLAWLAARQEALPPAAEAPAGDAAAVGRQAETSDAQF